MTRECLGFGVLTWNRSERISDRYGYVALMPEGGNSIASEDYLPLNTDGIEREFGGGKKCQLVADVIEARESTHIGDLFHGFVPTKPDVGERIVLGQGMLSLVPDNGGMMVGLMPFDDRRHFWLDPPMLYRAHEQSVRLWIEVAE